MGVEWGTESPGGYLTAVSWTYWETSEGVQIEVSGDPDWGDAKYEGTPLYSDVRDTGDMLNKLFTVTLGTGAPSIYIRGQAASFDMFDETPAWEEYTDPVAESWRYVQVRLGDADFYELPADRSYSWSPGIPGGIPDYTTVHSTVGAPYNDGSTDATAAINNAIAAAGAVASAGNPQVVKLIAGTYRLTSGEINMNQDYVVLRGAGWTTKIWADSASQAIRMGIFWGSWNAGVALSANAAKGATSITVGDASSFSAGDIIKIDQLDDTDYVVIGNATYSKRGPGGDSIAGPVSSGGYRSVSQHNQVVSKSGAGNNTLNLLDPLAIERKTSLTAEVYSGSHYTQYAGVEDLYITGGIGGNIRSLRIAYCWVKNVESDGSTVTGHGETGYHIGLTTAYKCEVRQCYTHDATANESGGDAYGIVMSDGTTACLIEDNICRDHCKPIVSHPSGGCNVIAYNYIDQAIIDSTPGWQEVGGDCHLCFAHFDLWEGNWAPNLGAQCTHGNSGWQTYFRNYCRGRNSDDVASAFIHAILVEKYMWSFNVIGNVLMEEHPVLGGLQPIYEHSSSATNKSAACVYNIGYYEPGYGDEGQALSTVLRDGNYDYVTDEVRWHGIGGDPGDGTPATLPDSLYLSSKPSFFGASPWPWVTPTETTKYYTLPAKARFDAM